MANLTYIVPTRNLNQFNVGSVSTLLQEEFPQFRIRKNDDISISIFNDKDKVASAFLRFNQVCDMISFH